jgi:hypothetical protein
MVLKVRNRLKRVKVPEHITVQMKNRIAQISESDPTGHPLMAILVATLEAAFESGLVEPLHVSLEDCNGTVKTSTIQQGNITNADNSVVQDDLQFPLHLVVTDEVNNGKLDVNIETTEEANGDWTFDTQVSWLS